MPIIVDKPSKNCYTTSDCHTSRFADVKLAGSGTNIVHARLEIEDGWTENGQSRLSVDSHRSYS